MILEFSTRRSLDRAAGGKEDQNTKAADLFSAF
jgi:hypothetical protein